MLLYLCICSCVPRQIYDLIWPTDDGHEITDTEERKADCVAGEAGGNEERKADCVAAEDGISTSECWEVEDAVVELQEVLIANGHDGKKIINIIDYVMHSVTEDRL
jgi:hypothetical protein